MRASREESFRLPHQVVPPVSKGAALSVAGIVLKDARSGGSESDKFFECDQFPVVWVLVHEALELARRERKRRKLGSDGINGRRSLLALRADLFFGLTIWQRWALAFFPGMNSIVGRILLGIPTLLGWRLSPLIRTFPHFISNRILAN